MVAKTGQTKLDRDSRLSYTARLHIVAPKRRWLDGVFDARRTEGYGVMRSKVK
jgi:hypothetical protein